MTLNAGDLQGLAPGASRAAKAPNGVWELTVGPVAPGAYRYTFNVDGVQALDPRNTSVSQNNTTVQSWLYVLGAAFMDAAAAPHAAVARVYCQSSTLKRVRRMHVYTPPGYDTGAR